MKGECSRKRTGCYTFLDYLIDAIGTHLRTFLGSIALVLGPEGTFGFFPLMWLQPGALKIASALQSNGAYDANLKSKKMCVFET